MDKIFIIAIVCIIVFCTPLAIIWALNTLFTLSIAYTFKTWVAALVLGTVVSRTVTVKKN